MACPWAKSICAILYVSVASLDHCHQDADDTLHRADMILRAVHSVLARCANLCYATAVQGGKTSVTLLARLCSAHCSKGIRYDVSSRPVICQSHPHAAAVYPGEGGASGC